MKKTLSVLALCLALLLVFTACSAPAQTTESAASEVSTNSEGRNVTFVLKNLVNPFCVTVKEGAEQAAKDLNVNLSVLTPIQGDNNEELMQLIEQAVASGSCDTIVVFPSDSIGIVPAVKKAYDAKIPVVLLNTGITTDEVIWESFVACENWEVGRACGEALAEKMNYKGKVILIEGVVGAQNSIVSAISAITPPVAVAAYAAAGISEGDPNATGVQAVRLAVAAYIVPFVFMYRPALILDGSLPEILWTAVVATAAVYSFASGLEGYLHGRLRFPLRLALMAAGVVFVWPDTWADLIGFAILGAVTAHQYAIRKNNPDPVCLAQPQGE